MLFFDLEYYVPLDQRESKKSTLRANPNKKGQFLLGGFAKSVPHNDNSVITDSSEFWIWNESSLSNMEEILKAEEKVLKKLYQLFEQTWLDITQNFSKRNDLIVVGTGVARFDLPILYIRSCKYNFASKEELFSTFLTVKPIDLTTLGIAYVKPKRKIKPVSTSDLMRSLEIERSKKTGQVVWDLYDNEEYKKIEERTKSEVEMNIKIFNEQIRRIRQKYSYRRTQR